MFLNVLVEDFLAAVIVVAAVFIKEDIVTEITGLIILTIFMFSIFLRQAFLDLFCLNL